MKKIFFFYFIILLASQFNFIKNDDCDKDNPSGVEECERRPAGDGNYKFLCGNGVGWR